jgi:thiosulfate/3-mercaptopyruvate sulfurtransferase
MRHATMRPVRIILVVVVEDPRMTMTSGFVSQVFDNLGKIPCTHRRQSTISLCPNLDPHMLSRKVPVLFYASLLVRSSASAFVVGRATGTTLTHSRFFTTTTTTTTTTQRQMLPSDSLFGKLMVPVPDAIGLHAEKDVKFVDGSWFLMGRNGRQEFRDQPRIAGAHFFDIDDIAERDSPYPHMMPTPELFAAAMDAMGISNTDHVIVYASRECPFVHRAWFQIRSMGHGSAYTHLLDGSVADWNHQGGPMEQGEPSNAIVVAKDLDVNKSSSYQASTPQGVVVVDKDEMKRIISQGDAADAIIVDVRAPERFRGDVEEPRPGMRLGHMPGAKNVFFKDLLRDDNLLRFKPTEELKNIIARGGVDIMDTEKRIIVHCGSGATACALVAAMELCGRDPTTISVYDASWSEWGSVADTPIEKDGKPVA